MADDNFFNDVQDALGGDNTVEAQADAVEKIKVGDKEYSQEELTRLVGLGEIGAEAEARYDTKLDKVWPNFQKTVNDNKALREQLSAKEAAEIQAKASTGVELSPDELRKQALSQARELGIVTKEDLNEVLDSYYTNRRAGEQLLEQTDTLVKEAADLGKPKTTTAELLEFMQERGFRNPQDAYEIMFKDQIRKWEADQLKSVRPSGLYSQSQSTAGGKTPANVKITKDNLEQLVSESLNSGGQGA
jgi:hypothetical protein